MLRPESGVLCGPLAPGHYGIRLALVSNATSRAGTDEAGPGRKVFVTTRWSVVLAAGHSDTAGADAALSRLCETYWHPLYFYVRRRGYPPEDAQDLTQEFFARLLEHRWVSVADPARGRFRTFLLTAMDRFLANEWDRARAKKRGGGAVALSLDTTAAEAHYQGAIATAAGPDALYDREWAFVLLDRALHQLADEHQAAGKSDEFTALSPCLTAARGEILYDDLAARLGMTETAARQAVHRLRKRYREVFREEIGQTLKDPAELEAEVRHLLAALAG